MRRSSKGFALTGKAKPAQFTERVKGQKEKGFKQKTEKQATAAMSGHTPVSGKIPNQWVKPARKDASKQFANPAGKKVF